MITYVHHLARSNIYHLQRNGEVLIVGSVERVVTVIDCRCCSCHFRGRAHHGLRGTRLDYRLPVGGGVRRAYQHNPTRLGAVFGLFSHRFGNNVTAVVQEQNATHTNTHYGRFVDLFCISEDFLDKSGSVGGGGIGIQSAQDNIHLRSNALLSVAQFCACSCSRCVRPVRQRRIVSRESRNSFAGSRDVITLIILHHESLYNACRTVSIAEGGVVVVDTLIDNAQYDTFAGIGLGQSGGSGLCCFYNLV